LVRQIMGQRPDLHPAIRGGEISILTPLEADRYTFEQVQRGARKIAFYTGRRAHVDRSGFTPDELAVAEHRDAVSTGMRIALLKEKKRLKEAEDLRLLEEGG
jgi:hypothetical protein